MSRLKAGWTGTASDGFQAWGGQLAHSLTDSAEQCDRVAGQLDEVAVRVRSTNDQVRERYLAIGVTVAAGVAFTVMTLGVSDAAAGATMTAEATEAASVVATLTTFFNSLLGRWVVAFGINLVATGVEKAWVNPDHNPVGGWEPGDLTHALPGADALAVAAPIAEAIPGFKAFRVAHPFRSAAVVSGSAAGTAAFASDLSAFGFEGKPLGLETLIDVGVSAGGSGVISGAAEWGAARFVTKPPPLASVDSVLSKAKVGDSLEALGFGVREAHEPHGWARSESGLLVPVTGESGSVDLITPRTTLPKLAGIRPDEWEKGPGGLLVPEPGASHPALGVKFQSQPGTLWQESQQVRKGIFKLVLKGLSNTVLHARSSAAPPPAPLATAPVSGLAPAPSVPLPPPDSPASRGRWHLHSATRRLALGHRQPNLW